VHTTTYLRLGVGCVDLQERVVRLEALVRGLVREVNVYNQPDCLGGYHNGLGDTWVAEGDSTTFNQELQELGLEQLENVVSKYDSEDEQG
jgi:hypothetical protein